MKISVVNCKNCNDLEVILFKLTDMKDIILFDVLNFSDNFEPPEYLKEILKLEIKQKLKSIFTNKKK